MLRGIGDALQLLLLDLQFEQQRVELRARAGGRGGSRIVQLLLEV
jgi:hypothetical protein